MRVTGQQALGQASNLSVRCGVPKYNRYDSDTLIGKGAEDQGEILNEGLN